ncbi:MAG: hypothetical protein IGNPGNKH_00601 [Sodalis sp. Ffu]|nr:MAG: hypothetical protein IGNPGNKH_00601 [Sodalis sp. Ffu]
MCIHCHGFLLGFYNIKNDPNSHFMRDLIDQRLILIRYYGMFACTSPGSASIPIILFQIG